MIYLDSAATTLQKPESVHRAVAEAMATCASLGRSGHAAARRASEVALSCREAAGRLFETPPEQVVNRYTYRWPEYRHQILGFPWRQGGDLGL